MTDECGRERERLADPLSDVVGLVRPRAVVGKEVSGAGRWALRFAGNEAIDFALVTAGRCHYDGPGGPLELGSGDFLLLCAPPAFRFGNDAGSPAVDGDAAAAASGRGSVLRLGDRTAESCRLMAGHFFLLGANAGFVVRLLPSVVVVRSGDESGRRLQHLLLVLAEEVAQGRPGRELVLARLSEVVLIEALRWSDDRPARRAAPPGFVQGLADPVIGAALVALHAGVGRPWTVARLAAEVGVSRSVLADRFPGTVGVPPMTYLLRWRIALARRALAEGDASLAEVAHAVGFGSASALSAAFLRVTGVRPGRWAREQRGRSDAAISDY